MLTHFSIPNEQTTRPPIKDKDTHNTKIQPYLPGEDIWAFLERLGIFFKHANTKQGDMYSICFDRLSPEAMTEFNSTDPTNNDRRYDTLTRQLCTTFGPHDPATTFSKKLSDSRQDNKTALEFCITLYSTWKAYLLYLHSQNSANTIPHDTQFIQFYLAGLNDEERMTIEGANANKAFQSYSELNTYLRNRMTIWDTLQRRHNEGPHSQPQRNLNMHPSRSNAMDNNHKEHTTNNSQSTESQLNKFAETMQETMANTMTQFANKLTQSLNTMSSTISETLQKQGQDNNKLNYHGSTPDMSNLNNHRSDYHPHYNSDAHHNHREQRDNSRMSNHHASTPHNDNYNELRTFSQERSHYDNHSYDKGHSYLNYHGGHNKHERSRSPHNHSRGRYQNNTRSRSTSPLGGTNNCFGCGDELHVMIDCKELTDEERDVQCARIIYNKKMTTEEATQYRKDHNLLDQPTNRAATARSRNTSTLNRGQPGYCHWCNSCGHYTINCTKYCVLCKKEGHGWRECTTASRDIVARRTRNLQPLIQSRAKQFGATH